ncbi:MAG TPA: PP2C family protein-serine/threonine phosphatase [Bryobacteraceae bacterium]|nr:PP2C family protein-serine/threonine phosphatase [Bryobacteraceae bacterium]
MPPTAEQLRAVLRTSIASLSVGILTTSIGLFAIAEHIRRGRSKSRLLLWFGLFAGLYGVRSLGRNAAIALTFNLPAGPLLFLAAVVDYVILVPAFLFMEEIYGTGWKHSSRWLVWAAAGYGVLAVALSAILRNPYVLPEPGGITLIVVPALLIANYLMGYRPQPIAEAKTLIVGLVVFLGFVANSHLAPSHTNVEPFGFFFFLCCLGGIAAHRFRANEQQLLSLEEEMKAARRIQESILPSSLPRPVGVQVAVRYAPMTAVAGDFYDFLPVVDGCLGVLVADVAGHGVPAALGASMVKVAVSTQVGGAADPARMISELNNTMHRVARGQLVTAGFLALDIQARTGTYVAAGHPPLLLWRPATGTLREFSENGLVLGVLPNQAYPNMRFEVFSGDRIVMCTDGVWEAENRAGEIFGDSRFQKFIKDCGHLSADAMAGALLAEVTAWSMVNRIRRQADDITIVILGVD